MKESKVGNITLFILVGSMGGLLFGYNICIIVDVQHQILKYLSLKTTDWSIIVTSTIIGAFIGASIVGRVVDRLGSYRVLEMLSYMFIVCIICSAFSDSYYKLISARFLLGICIGGVSVASPMFIAEKAPTSLRGKITMINSVAITSGQALAFLIGYLLHQALNWRYVLLTGLLPAVIQLICITYIKYGISGKREVKFVYNKRRTNSYDLSILLKKCNFKVILLGVALGILQQTSGINIVMYYGPIIFRSLGLGESVSLLSTFFTAMINVIFTIVSLTVVDLIGRRPLWILGSIGSGISLLFLAFSQILNFNYTFSFISIIIYIMFFAMSLGCIFWLVISEIYPQNIRGTAMGIASSAQWLANILVSLMYLPLVSYLGASISMILFALFCFISALFGFYFLPETRGVKLSQIEKNIKENVALRSIGKKYDG